MIARIESLIDGYQITAAELGFAPRRPARPGPSPARYRDSRTGATWSGRGRPPRCLDGQDRAGFAIGQ